MRPILGAAGLLAVLLVAAAGAGAQPAPVPTIGFLGATSDSAWLDTGRMEAFRRGLREGGFVEGVNLRIEYRWADGHYDRLPALAKGLVERRVAAIVAATLPATLAAKKATETIPILFLMGADPVHLGVVASLNRPGGNATGVSQLFGALGPKRLELLRELLPSAAPFGVLVNRDNPNSGDHLRDIRAAAEATKQSLEIAHANDARGIDAAFAAFAARGVRGLVLADDPVFTERRAQIVDLAVRHALPTVYFARDFVAIGGLISYAPSANEVARDLGAYTARVLKGARPAELPVLLATKVELVINLKTAKALAIEIPPLLLNRADEVIE